MVQNCVDAASSDFNNYTTKKTRDAADVVGSKSLAITNPIPHHIQTLGSMQPSSVELLSKLLQTSGQACSTMPSEQVQSEGSEMLYRTNATISSSSSSGYESSFSRSSKSNRSWFNRLKRLMNFPSSKKTSDYPLSTTNYPSNEINASPTVTLRHNNGSNSFNNNNTDHRRQSMTRFDIRRKSGRRTLAPAMQHIPFLYGLKNCGNTCFINAIVQCLCHTEQLALYILTKSYETDMRNIKNALVQHQNSSNPITTPNFKVTKSFVQIFQALWNNSSNTTSKLLYDFKSIVGNLNRQYAGNEQNDAQEFLLFLINTIHDELNLVANGRCRSKTKTSFSSSIIGSQSTLSSGELARRAWSEYADANQSIITNTFSAQLHSTLRCNKCKKESKTFEPYLLLSLPIPQKMIKPVFITVVFLNQSPKQLQIGLCLPVSSTVKDVREAIAQQSNLDPTDLALVEISQNHGFSQVFHDSEPMSRLTGDVYGIQFPSSTPDNNEHSQTNVDPVSSQSTTNNLFVNLLVLNRVRMTSGRCERFGTPIAVRVPKESTYRALQLSIIKAQRSLIRDEAMQYAQEFVVFQLALIDHYQSITSGTVRQEYPIAHDVQWPLYLEKIVEILEMYDGPGLGPSHIQVYATWHEKYIAQFISRWGAADDKPDIHQSVAQARAALHQPSTSTISLADCFSLFTQSESLNYDDAWMCTHCRRKENGTMKNLKISTLPSVLIIHLKRFCQTKLSNAKLVYPVQFPLIGLDVRRFLSTNRTEESVSTSDSGAEDDHDPSFDHDQEKHYGLYDLYAVCNHRGTMSNGHYTAYCKNPITNKWFCYDDHLVSEIDPTRVCTPDAYILFYHRRHCHSSPTSDSIKSTSSMPIDATVQDFDEKFNLEETPIVDEKQNWSLTNKERTVHYTLEPPLPLPRRLVTNVPVQSFNDDVVNTPCPAPRARKTPSFDEDFDVQHSQTILPPSPPTRRILPSSQASYITSIVQPSQFVEPLANPYPVVRRYPYVVDQPNPWNRYNNHRYSDDEPETNVIYPRAILR